MEVDEKAEGSKAVQMTIYLPKPTFDRLVRVAKDSGRRRSSLVSWLLEAALKRYEQELKAG